MLRKLIFSLSHSVVFQSKGCSENYPAHSFLLGLEGASVGQGAASPELGDFLGTSEEGECLLTCTSCLVPRKVQWGHGPLNRE